MLPLIRARLEESARSRVLDFGLPSTNKLIYLSRCRSSIYWNNFPGGLGDWLRNGIEEKSMNRSAFGDFLISGAQEKFDVVLLWDYLDYLRFDLIRELIAQLSPYCKPQCWLYFLISQGAKMPAMPADIDLTLDDSLRYRATPLLRTAPRFAPKVLEEGMPGFRIFKLYLLKNGVQEHMFQFHPAPASPS